MLPIFNGSGLGLPGSGVSPPEAVSYPISPTGSSLGASHVVVVIGTMMLLVEEVNLGFRAFSIYGTVV